MAENHLLLSDLQIPYEAENALSFCKYVKNHFKISDENCINVGDELDAFHGGLYPKGADYAHSPKGEIAIAKEKLKEWYAAFPKMKVAISNHGMRWIKKATAAEIPSELLRQYKEVFEAPSGWQWKDEWIIDTGRPFRVIHGMGYSGKDAARNAAIDAGMSTVIGHVHSFAGISYLKTAGRKDLIWAMNAGCLIDVESFAFAYGKYNRAQPCLGIGVVMDSGKRPIWLPYE